MRSEKTHTLAGNECKVLLRHRAVRVKGFRGKGILGLKDSGLKALRLSFFGVKGFEG